MEEVSPLEHIDKPYDDSCEHRYGTTVDVVDLVDAHNQVATHENSNNQ